MSIDRRKYLEDLDWTHDKLAKRCGVSKKSIQRWVKREKVELDTHEKICKGLAVPLNFFDSAEQMRRALDWAWYEVGKVCPQYQQWLQRITMRDDGEVLDALCNDLENSNGRNYLTPAIAQLGSMIPIDKFEELDVIERFMGYAFLLTLDPDHQLSVNAGERNPEPMALTGATKEYVARMLVHYQYPLQIGPMSVHVQQGEVESSPGSVFFPETTSVEQPVEEEALDFLKEMAHKKRAAAYAKLRSEGGTATFDSAKLRELVEEINGEIGQKNVSRDYTLAVAGPEASIECARYVKKNYLPDLRIACFTPGTILNILRVDEHSIDALVRSTAEAIQALRATLSNTIDQAQESKDVSKSKVTMKNCSVGSFSTGDYGIQNTVQLASVDVDEGRELVRSIARELLNEGNKDQAAQWQEIADEPDRRSFIQKAKQLLTEADAPLSVCASAASLGAQLSTWLLTIPGAGQ